MPDNLFPACGDDSDNFQKMYNQHLWNLTNLKIDQDTFDKAEKGGLNLFGTLNQKSANANWFNETWNKAHTINQNQEL